MLNIKDYAKKFKIVPFGEKNINISFINDK